MLAFNLSRSMDSSTLVVNRTLPQHSSIRYYSQQDRRSFNPSLVSRKSERITQIAL